MGTFRQEFFHRTFRFPTSNPAGIQVKWFLMLRIPQQQPWLFNGSGQDERQEEKKKKQGVR